MKINLTVKRVNIGQFWHIICTSTESLDFQISHLKSIISLLLLISGIEPNPGPFICKICKKALYSVRHYVKHQMIHAENPKFRYECPHSNCKRTFSSAFALQNHLYRNHEKVTKPVLHGNSNEVFSCKQEFCSKICLDIKDLIQHTRSHLNEIGCVVVCAYKNCSKTLKTKNSFNVHLYRCHDNYTKSYRASDAPYVNMSSRSDSDPEPSVEDEEQNEGFAKNYSATDLKELIIKFYLKLESEYMLPASTVTGISKSLMNLLELSHLNLKNFLVSELKKIGLEKDKVSNILDNYTQNDQLYNMMLRKDSSLLPKLNSKYQRLSTYKSHFRYVEPQQFFLGFNKDDKPTYGYHVPISGTLDVLLSDEVISNEITKKKLVIKAFWKILKMV